MFNTSAIFNHSRHFKDHCQQHIKEFSFVQMLILIQYVQRVFACLSLLIICYTRFHTSNVFHAPVMGVHKFLVQFKTHKSW